MDSRRLQLFGCKVCRNRSNGFSLMELLVVLVILGVLTSVAAPATGRFLDSIAFKKQTNKVMASLRYVRLKAVASGEPLVITVEEGEKFLTISGAISENKDLGLEDDDILELEPAEIVFFPEGHATPGVLTFFKGDRSMEIIIDPLSGLPVLDYSDD